MIHSENTNKLVLVTGGSGFVGSHCILQLLEKGYSVRTTVRSLSKKNQVIKLLENGGITSFENLQFVEADLTSDTNWDHAVKDCEYVLHVASPIFLALPKDENEMIRPAIEGTLRVLRAARNAGVKRVVMTSNFGAVGYSHTDPHIPITEESWTNPNQKGLSSYNKSKVLAERAAWNFMKTEGRDMELSVINPTAIFGPSLGPDISSGFELLKALLDGSMKSVPNLTFNIIDVRDVADLHLRAMINPNAKGQRFLALAGGKMSMPEIAAFLRKELPAVSQKVSVKTLPDWKLRLAALFSPRAKAIASMLSASRNVSNAKAKEVFEWKPRSTNEEAILAAVESMIRYKSI
ncbi:SDR family oxidoreductase [Fluviicola chungangensis]|uniref:Aldehyde reductase n=1 Tax=Fluviicola chungangensis TaxID=2597671 RepID=A0A556MY83_9FLAO|nr:aldehyde reductase [Fluviicola chungangensis]TSJ44872.1 aldehyde reductase [Fluviicola chungangensis]